MKLLAKGVNTTYTDNGDQLLVLTLAAKTDTGSLETVISNGKLLTVEITQPKKKRSLDSNSYMWVLCQKIAEALQTTKEQVYRKFIRDVGQFEIVPIKDEAVERWIEIWNSKGLGWFAEVMEDSKLSGYKKVINYYGSSCYDSREMSVLIDEVVTQAKELGIETLTPDELMALKERWKGV